MMRVTDNQAILIERYKEIREISLKICEPLETEDYCVQPCPEVSPPKWHLAHTTWFFEELILKKCIPNYSRFNEKYPMIFNSYYKSAGEHWAQSQRGQLSRPTVNEVKDYRYAIDKQVYDLLSTQTLDEHTLKVFETGLQHEQQHQELLVMDLKFILAYNPLQTKYQSSLFQEQQINKSNEWFQFSQSLNEVGNDGNEFAFDNECPRHKVYTLDFAIRDLPVTNAEYLEFINDGGYTNPKLWLSMGWDWLEKSGVKAPLYWHTQDGSWFEYKLNGDKPIEDNQPVQHISYYEASAFANWKGARLPTEFEMEHFLVENKLPRQKLWSWTSSQYTAYPGFKAFDGFLEEYNGKFMCNQFVLRGGCFATPMNHYRHTYRNFYMPQQRWMFSGIHLAK